MDRPVSEVSQIRWVPVLNDSGEAIPAFAAMRVTGVDTSVAGETTHKVGKPNSDNQTDVLFNGPCEIGIGLTGIGTPDLPATARYDEGDGTPSAGAEWGVESGGWKLRDSKTGFRVAGVLGTGFASVMGVTPAGGSRSIEFQDDKGGSVTGTIHRILNSTVADVGGDAHTTIDDAGATYPGIVNTDTGSEQTLGDGDKRFQKSLKVELSGTINNDHDTSHGLTAFNYGYFEWLDDNSYLQANTFLINPIAYTTQAHDQGFIDGFFEAVNTDTAVKYSENGFQAQVFRLYDGNSLGDVLAYVQKTAAGSGYGSMPGIAQVTGAAADSGQYIGFDTFTDTDAAYLRFTLLDTDTDGWVRSVGNDYYRNAIQIVTNWTGGTNEELANTGFTITCGAAIIGDEGGTQVQYPAAAGQSITPPTFDYVCFGVTQRGFPDGQKGTFWGWSTPSADNTAGEGLVVFRGGLAIKPTCNAGDIEYADDDNHLARLAIGNEGQVLTVVDVAGDLLPRWEDVPYPDAANVTYTPLVDADWTDPDPTNVADALDALAAREADGVLYTPAPETNWTDPDPTVVQDALDRLAAAVAGLLGGSIP